MERSRAYLRQEFRDGEKPSGTDFGDLVDSSLNRVDDGVTIDGNGNLSLTRGLQLGSTNAGDAGALRFSGGRVQFNNGATWVNVGEDGGGGAFVPVGAADDVAYGDGNVGIGDFNGGPPTHRLEVELGPNSGPGERVQFGNANICNGNGALQQHALFAHRDQTSNTAFALRQTQTGETNLNAPNGQRINLSQNRTQVRLHVASTGAVVINRNGTIPGAQPTDVFQVNGIAAKNQGGTTWRVASDARLKQDIHPFQDGLAKLLDVNPVRFKYKQSYADHGQEEVGIIGQEMEKIFPYMISQNDASGDDLPKDLRLYDGNALTYVMVNAIKELAGRVEELERKLAAQA